MRSDVTPTTKAYIRKMLIDCTAARDAFATPVAYTEADGESVKIHFSSTDTAVVDEFLAWCDARGIEVKQESDVVPLLWYDGVVTPDQGLEFKLRWRGLAKINT